MYFRSGNSSFTERTLYSCNSFDTKQITEPESFSIYFIASVLRDTYNGTVTKPDNMQAKSVIIHSVLFSEIIATFLFAFKLRDSKYFFNLITSDKSSYLLTDT